MSSCVLLCCCFVVYTDTLTTVLSCTLLTYTVPSSTIPTYCLDEDEWGLLASSSSRLARALLMYCFHPPVPVAVPARDSSREQVQDMDTDQDSVATLVPTMVVSSALAYALTPQPQTSAQTQSQTPLSALDMSMNTSSLSLNTSSTSTSTSSTDPPSPSSPLVFHTPTEGSPNNSEGGAGVRVVNVGLGSAFSGGLSTSPKFFTPPTRYAGLPMELVATSLIVRRGCRCLSALWIYLNLSVGVFVYLFP